MNGEWRMIKTMIVSTEIQYKASRNSRGIKTNRKERALCMSQNTRRTEDMSMSAVSKGTKWYIQEGAYAAEDDKYKAKNTTIASVSP